jgi:hypothetical protein
LDVIALDVFALDVIALDVIALDVIAMRLGRHNDWIRDNLGERPQDNERKSALKFFSSSSSVGGPENSVGCPVSNR